MAEERRGIITSIEPRKGKDAVGYPFTGIPTA
jgi:hypothetical protein